MAGRLLVGTSGYVYPHWRRLFYPRSVPVREWLPFYARRFDTVELNNPFYRLPDARTFRGWAGQVPPGFVFAVKASRYLTHLKRLREPGPPLSRLLRRAAALGPALGPVLFQLPGNFPANAERLDGFLRAVERQRRVPGLRAVLEVRHASWLVPEIHERLRKANVALCLADWRSCPVPGPLTADFVYVRRHGAGRRGGGYTDATLRSDAREIRGWLRDGRDVHLTTGAAGPSATLAVCCSCCAAADRAAAAEALSSPTSRSVARAFRCWHPASRARPAAWLYRL